LSKAGLKVFQKLVKAALVSVSVSVEAQFCCPRKCLNLSLLFTEKSLDLVLEVCLIRLVFFIMVKLIKWSLISSVSVPVRVLAGVLLVRIWLIKE
jgi:hypothetical protein